MGHPIGRGSHKYPVKVFGKFLDFVPPLTATCGTTGVIRVGGRDIVELFKYFFGSQGCQV
jgi:hypothetical protein